MLDISILMISNGRFGVTWRSGFTTRCMPVDEGNYRETGTGAFYGRDSELLRDIRFPKVKQVHHPPLHYRPTTFLRKIRRV